MGDATERSGRYRLFRQSQQTAAFALVRVAARAATGADPADVQVAIDPSDPNTTTAQHDPDFVAAAIEGVRDGLALLARLGVSTVDHETRLTGVGITYVDSTPGAVRAAAAAAIADAFGAADRVQVVYDNGWVARAANQT